MDQFASKQLSVTALILTFNESMHIARCIESIQGFCQNIIVVDSISTDDTVEIASSMGALVYQHAFTSHSSQIKWALENCPFNTDWIFRIDADEYATIPFQEEIFNKLSGLSKNITGVFINVQVYFIDRIIRHGGHYPIKLIRLWRSDAGYIEPKFMDERIILKYGENIYFNSDLVDHNLNTLTWWTNKQNGYALREAADLLNQEYGFFETMNVDTKINDPSAQRRRMLKTGIYNKAPLFLRVFLYFFYRYFIRLGFLDGKSGLIWHILQGFWLRFLVDAKIWQVKSIANKSGREIKVILIEDFGLKIN